MPVATTLPSSRITTNRSRKAQVRHDAIIILAYYMDTRSRRFASARCATTRASSLHAFCSFEINSRLHRVNMHFIDGLWMMLNRRYNRYNTKRRIRGCSSKDAAYLEELLSVAAARKLREACALGEEPVENCKLLDLLGVSPKAFSNYGDYSTDIPVSFGKNISEGRWEIVPRNKVWQTSRRFEFARVLGDALTCKKAGSEWLVASDNKSARQKSQRAFAAEFLCPINALDEFLGCDYSETRREKASRHFKVSSQTIDSLLVNNGRIERNDSVFPYTA